MAVPNTFLESATKRGNSTIFERFTDDDIFLEIMTEQGLNEDDVRNEMLKQTMIVSSVRLVLKNNGGETHIS